MITFISSLFSTPTINQKIGVESWTLAGIKSVTSGACQSGSVLVQDVRTEASLGFKGDSPLVNDLLKKALLLCDTPWIALINADIYIKPDFKEILGKIETVYGQDIFMSCYRWDLAGDADMFKPDDLDKLSKTPHQDKSADIFIASIIRMKELAEKMPDFILGRMVWDNWIHLYFQRLGIRCMNASNVLPVYHFNHGYSHMTEPWPPPAVKHNISIMSEEKIIGIGSWPEPVI